MSIRDRVYPTTHTIMPATTDLKRAPKLIWLDTGLVNYAAEIQKEYLLDVYKRQRL